MPRTKKVSRRVVRKGGPRWLMRLIGGRKGPRVLKAVKYQTGERKSISRDRMRKALRPGKRISKSGRIYWETRRNRSDLYGRI